MSNRPPRTESTESRSKRWIWIPVVLGALVFVPILFFLSVFVFGRVSGSEFSPVSFKRREFTYFHIPLVRTQIWPINRKYEMTSLERRLVSLGYVSDTTLAERWDLLDDNQSKPMSPAFDAQILTQYLDSRDANDRLIWEQWTLDHPGLADVFWPTVVGLARLDRYLEMPSLFRLASNSESPTELRALFASLLAKDLIEIAVQRFDQGRLAEAEIACDLLILHDSSFQEAIDLSDSIERAIEDQANQEGD